MLTRQPHAFSRAGVKVFLASVLSLMLIVAVGCDDDDDGDTGTGPNTRTYRDFNVNMNDFEPYVGLRMEFRVIDDSNQVQAVAVLDPLNAPDADFTMPNALTRDADHVDVWLDQNANATYDVPPGDLAWRFDVPSSGQVNFEFDSNFTDVGTSFTEPGEDLVLNLSGFSSGIGAMMEVRVVDSLTGQTVGLYRTRQIPADAFTVTIPGIIQNARAYQIDMYADVNASGDYNNPPTDYSWRIFGTGTGTGLNTNFAYTDDYVVIDF